LPVAWGAHAPLLKGPVAWTAVGAGLTCGDVGVGAMADLELIVRAVADMAQMTGKL